MRRAVAGIVGLALAFGPAALRAEPPAEAPGPTILEQAVDEVLAAAKAKDEAALRRLAQREEPDPWLVADALCAQGHGDVARAFALASPRPDVARLPAVLAARSGVAADVPVRAAVERAEADTDDGKPSEALARLDAAPAPPGSIVSVQWTFARARALAALDRAGDADAAWKEAAAQADALGWLCAAAGARLQRGVGAYRHGDMKEAIERWKDALTVQEARKDEFARARTLESVAQAQQNAGLLAAALETQRAALAVWRSRHDDRRAAEALGTVGGICSELGDLQAAIAAHKEALALERGAGLDEAAAGTLAALGDLYARGGDRRNAVARLEEAVAAQRAAHDEAGLTMTLRLLGRTRCLGGDRSGVRLMTEALEIAQRVHLPTAAVEARLDLGACDLQRGDPVAAATWFTGAREAAEAAGYVAGRAKAVAYLGAVAAAVGDFRKAVVLYEQAQEVFESTGQRAALARVLGEICDLDRRLGDHAGAEEALRLAQKAAEAVGDRELQVVLATRAAFLQFSKGDLLRALQGHEKARGLAHEAGLRSAEATALSNLGAVYLELDDPESAATSLDRARAIALDLDDRPTLGVVLVNLADVRVRMGRPADALPLLDEARALAEGAKDRAAVASVLLASGEVAWRLGRSKEALGFLDRVEREAESLGDDDLLARSLAIAAQARLTLQEPDAALEIAKRALPILERVLRGRGEDEGATARAQYADLYDAGVRAAAVEGDAAQTVRFIESGRAGSLLMALGGRDALRAAALDADLQQADAEARAREASAGRLFADAMERGDRQEIHAASVALDAAHGAVQDVVARIQRVRRFAAPTSILYPRATTVEDLEAGLRPGEAMVLYGLTTVDAVAVVVTAKAARVVPLGPTAALDHACEAVKAEDLAVDTKKAMEPVTALAVAPLALPSDVKRVLVSPDGALAYVSPALLFPDRPVALIPSGTAYVALADQRDLRGAGVLALGDPDYGAAATRGGGGGPLPLPKSRDEANAVGRKGSKGNKVLLGKDATVAGLRAWLATKPRWRAVHIACHGRADRSRPWLSWLWLAPDATDDGRLLARDVALTRVPADLAVLSACDTGSGRVVRGEGLLGMARAFMAAGSPRVIASLWKVDDAATQALMERFYDSWDPQDGRAGLPAAEALCEAQAFVATQKGWQHPAFWAAWVLWGLPD